MHANLPFVTVIMPVLNEAACIDQTLNAVVKQKYPPDRLEILVVDGGSSDGTPQIIKKVMIRQPNVRLLENPRKIQAAALNIGIQNSQGDIIVRVDGHTNIAPDYVLQCVNRLRQTKADNVGGLMQPVGTTFVGRAVALAASSRFGAGDAKFHYAQHEQYVDTVYLGAFWRKTFERIGFYDEGIHINEDYELNYRLRQAGGKILLSPAIQSTYTPRGSLGALWRQYFVYGRQKVLTLKKHPKSLRWRQTAAPMLVAGLVGSITISLIWRPARWLFYVLLICYLLANLLASTIAARKGGWRYLPVLPTVFAIIHFAWGWGFWYGWLRRKP